MCHTLHFTIWYGGDKEGISRAHFEIPMKTDAPGSLAKASHRKR